MTIAELLQKLSAAYPAFNSKASEVWAPVYRATLGDHEGPVLLGAFRDTLASFEATPRKGYPSPKDFLLNLPIKRLDLGLGGGPSLREPMVRRQGVFARLMAEWWGSQGLRIEQARGYLVANACRHGAEDLAREAAWKDDPPAIRLTAEQIAKCEERTASRQRVVLFGPLPSTNAAWDQQMAQARALMAGSRPVRIAKARREDQPPRANQDRHEPEGAVA